MKDMTEQVVLAVESAAENGLAHAVDLQTLSGFSGEKLIGCLQRLTALLADREDRCYLEVGVFKGLTLLSVALACPRTACFGVDKFVAFGGRANEGVVLENRERLGAGNAHLVVADYESALADLQTHIGARQVGVYMVDGPHDYRSQLMCLLLARPYLAERAVIVVDDSNYLHVRQANADFLKTHPQFKLVFEAYTPRHPDNMAPRQLEEARAGWWNGVNIMMHDPEDRLPRHFPPTRGDRGLFINDHVLHGYYLADQTPEIIEDLQAVYQQSRLNHAAADLGKVAGMIGAINRLFKKMDRVLQTPFLNQRRFTRANTFSANLTRARLIRPKTDGTHSA